MKTVPDGVFKPKLTSSEAKGDMTTRVARSIVDGEAARRDAKTARLRAVRLAQEAEAFVQSPSVSKTTRKSRKK